MQHAQPHIYRQQTPVRPLALAIAGSAGKLSSEEARLDCDLPHRFGKADGSKTTAFGFVDIAHQSQRDFEMTSGRRLAQQA